MTIKLLTRMAGPGGVYPPGSLITLDSKQAQQLIDGGYAIKDGEQNGNVLHDNGRKRNTRQKG